MSANNLTTMLDYNYKAQQNFFESQDFGSYDYPSNK